MADTNKRIVYTEDDGSIRIIIPSPNTSLTIEEIQAKRVPTGKTSYIVDKSIFPAERHFRDAWTYTPD